MFVTMRARLELRAGDRLMCNFPHGGSYGAVQFSEKYHGKTATFMGYAEKRIGPLDHKGRKPGRYVMPDHVVIVFDGETNTQTLYSHVFEVLHPREHALLPDDFNFEDQLIGDLLYPVTYYSGDTVRYNDVAKYDADVHEVSTHYLSMPMNDGPVPRYAVFESKQQYETRQAVKIEHDSPSARVWLKERRSQNVPVADLALIQRGNVYHLYHDASHLSFDSDRDELNFWMRSGISKPARSKNIRTMDSLADCLEGFRDGVIDCFDGRPSIYQTCVLHDCWAEYRPRVRALTAKVYQAELAGEAA